MAKREDSKSPKYFSASEKQLPKGRKLTIDVPEGAPVPPKDSKAALIRKSSEEALFVYRQVLKMGKPVAKVVRTAKPGTDTPKSRQRPVLSGLNSPKTLEMLLTGHVSREATHRPVKKSATPKAHKRSVVPSTGVRTPKEGRARPLSATGSYGTKVPTPKSKTPRTTGKAMSQSARSDALSGLVTQVKGGATASVSSQERGLTEEQLRVKCETVYHEHLFQTFQALKFVKMLPQPDPEQIKSKRLNLPRRPGFEQRKTIVFDLDETLVHCCEDPATMGADVYLPVVFPTGEVVQAGINIRPYARECLLEANKDFEVMVFTASHQCYADVVLDFLDPDYTLIHHRLYRDNCVQVNGVFLKDLRVLNRPLSQVVIVDNAAYSFGFQLENGVPIISWRDDKHDKELFNLIGYMKMLSEAVDIRELNVQTFHLPTFYEDYLREFVGQERTSPRLRKLGRPSKPRS